MYMLSGCFAAVDDFGICKEAITMATLFGVNCDQPMSISVTASASTVTGVCTSVCLLNMTAQTLQAAVIARL